VSLAGFKGQLQGSFAQSNTKSMSLERKNITQSKEEAQDNKYQKQ